MELFKYQGAGNDFLIADGRDGRPLPSVEQIRRLCDRHYGVGADGLMVLLNSEAADFEMLYFNSDGSGGMMCGNGGRCIVAFAYDCGLRHFDFMAPDGRHSAEILNFGQEKTVRLGMRDVLDFHSLDGADEFFVDSGTRHFVRFVKDTQVYDVVGEGRRIRHEARFAPLGVNANFAEADAEGLRVRTYEKGVEDETCACGTGIVATAVAAALRGEAPRKMDAGEVWHYDVRAKYDVLAVDFVPEFSGEFRAFRKVFLTGPAAFVARIVI